MREYFDRFYLTDETSLFEEKQAEVTCLLQNAYWAAGRTDRTMLAAIQNSLNYGVFEAESHRLVGFARVVTDFATVCYLCDVFVAEEFRGMGLGKKLVSHILSHDSRLQGISGLLKTRDAADFYKSFGFEECKSLCMIRTSEKSGL